MRIIQKRDYFFRLLFWESFLLLEEFVFFAIKLLHRGKDKRNFKDFNNLVNKNY
nr:MAG TPA: hypothetical protein [Caudoviricetes sp.]